MLRYFGLEVLFLLTCNTVLVDGSCESLCLQAECLMENSIVCEKYGDLHTALRICNQAIGESS